MTDDELIESKAITAFNWRDIRNDQTLIYRLSILHSKVKRGPPCCPDAMKQFYDELKTIITNQKIQIMGSNNFKLKEKEMVYVDSLNEYITNDNLTDANAVEMLKENPSRVNRFVTLPDNVDAFVRNFSEGQEETKEVVPSKSEAKQTKAKK